MALVRTTLSTACAIGDNQIIVASATSVSANRLVLIDQELMRVATTYSSGTTVPVLRGQNGTQTIAHVVTAGVVHGLATDFDDPAVGGPVTSYPTQVARLRTSITATSTLTLPSAGTDLDIILNGTSVITLTIPVPTVEMDGTRLTVFSNGAAAHVLTITGGVAGAGSGYTTWTVNSSAPAAAQFIASNAVWVWLGGGISSGTTTKMASVIS